jgi:hypothetical protein
MTATLAFDPPTTDGTGVPRRRRAWLVVGLVVAAITILLGAWDLVGALSRQPVHYQRTWSEPVRTLDLDIGNGSVTLVGTDGAGAVVHADGARGLSTPTNEQTLEDGTLRIRSSCSFSFGSNWCSLSYRVDLPAGARVVAHSSNGAVTADGLTGNVELSSNNGRVTANAPSGTLTMHSSNGRVQVTGATSTHVSASSNNGSVRVGFARPPHAVYAHSYNGSVTVGVPRSDISYRVEAHSDNGRVSTPVRTDPSGSDTITALSNNGDVTVRYGTA